MSKKETINDILREMREEEWNCAEWGYLCKECPNVKNIITGYADRIEAALQREKAKIEADVMEQCMLGDAARIAIKSAFDKAEFDQAVSGPSAWDSVEDPVAEVRKMRGDKEAK